MNIKAMPIVGSLLFYAAFFPILIAVWPATAANDFNVDRSGVGVHGMDVVAYHRLGEAVPGNSAFAVVHNGVKYHFANKDHLAAFNGAPERYVPAYGGWCAYGVRVGKKFNTDPRVFKVVDGRLFLQLDQGTQKVWLKNLGKNIAIADRLWPRLKSVSPKLLDQ